MKTYTSELTKDTSKNNKSIRRRIFIVPSFNTFFSSENDKNLKEKKL